MPSSMELLAPAGDLKIFKSAINAGADAVYFGGDFFGARASATNFSSLDAKTALDYAHARGKKAYLTVNTLLKNPEIEGKLYEFMKDYYEAGIDGVIIQDFGVFTFLKDHFPDLELHASTQMSLMSKYGARFLKDAGASRIVTARELSLNEIKEIHENVDIEIEAFVHGALCVCYSGNCLMSSFIGGRSGNRGYCAQPCRLPYELLDENNRSIYGTEKYHLSPKDLWGIMDLPKMKDAGVFSYKIEGRLKNEAYVTNVVSVYRKYMDLLLSEGKDSYHVEEKDLKRLSDAGNRGGFTNLYFYERNGKELVDDNSPAFYQKNKNAVITDLPVIQKKLFGEFKAAIGEEISFTVWNDEGDCTTLTGGICEESKTKPTSKEEVLAKLSTSKDAYFCFDHIQMQIDENAFVPMKFVKALKKDALLFFTKEQKRQINPFLPLDEGLLTKKSSLQTIRISVSNKEQLEPLKEVSFPFDLILSEHLWLTDFDVKSIKDAYQNIYLTMPVVIRSHTIPLVKKKILAYKDTVAGFYASSYDGLMLLEECGISKKRICFSDRLYTYSNRSEEAFLRMGYENYFAPLELNEKELSHRANGTSEMLIYGYVPLMYTANCLSKLHFGCKKKEHTPVYLKDKTGAKFPVMNCCEICTNVLYNSLPLCLFEKSEKIKSLGFFSVRLDFSLESCEKEREILKIFTESYVNGETVFVSFKHTKGHLKRGVL